MLGQSYVWVAPPPLRKAGQTSLPEREGLPGHPSLTMPHVGSRSELGEPPTGEPPTLILPFNFFPGLDWGPLFHRGW